MSDQIISETNNTIAEPQKRKNSSSKIIFIAIVIIITIVLSIIGINKYGDSNQKMAEEYVKNTIEVSRTVGYQLNNYEDTDGENKPNVNVKTKVVDKNKHNNLYVVDATVDEKSSSKIESSNYFFVVHIEENNNYLVNMIKYDETNRDENLKLACSYMYFLQSNQQ